MILGLVRLGDHVAEPLLGFLVVGPVREQDRSVGVEEELAMLFGKGLDAPQKVFRVAFNVGADRVALDEVFGSQCRAVGGSPTERRLGDSLGHAPPHDRIV